MKGKAWTLLVLLLPHLLLSGCGRTAATSSDLPEGTAGKDSGGKGSAANVRNISLPENSGIVTDTAVDVFKLPEIQSERITQAIFNQPVVILEEQENWYRVRTADGNTGWVKVKFIDRDCTSIDATRYQYRVVVTSRDKKVLSHAKGGVTIKEVTMGTEFYALGKIDGSYEVALPGKATGWIKDSGTIQLDTEDGIPKTAAADFVSTAIKFKGTAYLWGGISFLGMDGPGLIYICSKINGLNLPRDVRRQYEAGRSVPQGSVQPGDLVFFSDNENKKEVTHAGIFTGDGKFIHASKSKGYVVLNSLDESYFQNRLMGIKRLF